jgi:Putative MetA-pathway of phenol degradation
LKHIALSLLFFLTTTLGGFAQEAPPPTVEEERPPSIPTTIRVDRPSFANSSDVVGEGVQSLESGVLVTATKGNSQALVQTPLLYRVGLNEQFELRLGTTGLNFQDTHAGWADILPGFKWNFHKSESLSVSLVGSVAVPLGNENLRPPSVLPSLSLATDIPLGSTTGFLLNAGVGTLGDERDRVVQTFATAGVSQNLGDRWALYVEGGVFGPDKPGNPTTTAGDVVVTYLINNNTQIDAAIFKGFSAGGLDWAATFGFSTRF